MHLNLFALRIALTLTALCGTLIVALDLLPAHGQVSPHPPLPVELSADNSFYVSIRDHAAVLIDNSRGRSPSDIMELSDGFVPIETDYVDFGLMNGRVWLRAELSNQTARSGPWRIDFGRQYIESLDAYIVGSSGQPARILTHTDRDPFSDRPIPSRMLTQDINIPSGETVTLLIGFTSLTTTFLPVGIGAPSEVVSRHSREATLNNLIDGALWAVVFVALIMMPIIGWRIATSFVAYIIAGFLYVFHADGSTFEYLFPSLPWLNERLNLVLMLALAGGALTFVRQLFDFKTHSPRFDHLLKLMTAGAAAFGVLALFFIDVPFVRVAGYSFVPICAVFQAAAGVLAFRKGLVGATPYLIGAALIFLSFAYATIAHLVPGRFDLDNTLDFGHAVLLIECFVFAAAIMLRVVMLRTERDKAVLTELALTRERLTMSETLQRSQAAYLEARKRSQKHRAQLSAVSHDLQQPLAALRLGLSGVTISDPATRAQMQAAFDFLEQLSNDQLRADGDDRSHIPVASGTIETFAISSVLDNVAAIFEPQAKSKGLRFSYHRSTGEVSTDPVALLRAVSNLVSNAVKHTQEGEVRLRTNVSDTAVQVIISDTGPGMSADVLRRMREPYETGNASSGTGLGLTLAQELSDAMGYGLEITSEPGNGTDCTLTVSFT